MQLQVLSEVSEAHLVAVFKLRVVGAILLDGVVRQVHKIIFESSCISGVSARARSNVTLSKKVAFHIMRNKDPHSYVEFPAVDKQRILNVFLYDELFTLYCLGLLAWARLARVLLDPSAELLDVQAAEAAVYFIELGG